MVEIPVQRSKPDQTFSTILNDTVYNFRFRYNSREDSWYFDVSESDGRPIRSGVKVVLGVFCGRQSTHSLFRIGSFWAFDTSGADEDPGLDDIGVDEQGNGGRVILAYVTTDDIKLLVFGTSIAPENR